MWLVLERLWLCFVTRDVVMSWRLWVVTLIVCGFVRRVCL